MNPTSMAMRRAFLLIVAIFGVLLPVAALCAADLTAPSRP